MAQQSGNRVTFCGERGVPMQFTKACVHGLSGGEELLQFKMPGRYFRSRLDRFRAAIENDIRSEVAARETEIQRLEGQDTVVELHMSLHIVEGQVLVAQDFVATELYVGIHPSPGIG